MTETPLIKVSFIYSEEHFSRLLQAERSRGGQLAYRAAAFLGFLGVVAFGPDFLTLPVLLGMVAMAFIARNRAAKTAFKQLPWRNQRQDWLIGPEEITVSCEAFTSAFKWYNILRVKEYCDGFLLQLKTGTFYWLPSDGFHSEDDVQSFRAMIKDPSLVLEAAS